MERTDLTRPAVPLADAAAAERASGLAQAGKRRQGNLWHDAWRRLRKNKLALGGLSVIVLLAVVAVFADVIAPYPYYEAFTGPNLDAPSLDFPFGTDELGRDLFSRIIYGARVSLMIAVVAQVIVLAIGVPIGAVAGFLGGQVDTISMRVVDVVYAIPQLLFVILITSTIGARSYNMAAIAGVVGGVLLLAAVGLSLLLRRSGTASPVVIGGMYGFVAIVTLMLFGGATLGQGAFFIFLAIGLTGWVTLARLTRAQVLSLRDMEYVQAARVAGASGSYIVLRHLLPNSLTPIIVALTFGIPQAIFIEAALSFAGVGISPPIPSWGQMVGLSQQYFLSAWHVAVFPSLAIAITMLAFTFLGDGLRDALDPRMGK